MRYRLFGPTGLRVSELCLGAMVFGNDQWGATHEESRRILDAFAEAGGNFIDTANIYALGESERIVGEFVAADRDRWVLATKYTCSTDPRDPNAGGSHRKSLTRALDASLKRLNTEYIDVYWVHMWDALTPVEELVRSLDDAVHSGKVLYVGVSDTPAWMVSRAVTLAELRGWSRFVGLQIPYSLVERSVERELVPMATELGMTVAAWAPLGGGLLTGRYGTDRERPADSRLTLRGGTIEQDAIAPRNLAIADAVNAVAARRGISSTQVALAWLRTRANGGVIPIIGVRSLAQLQDNLGVIDIVLDAEDVERLEAASRIVPGFPHDFRAANLAYGETFASIDHDRELAWPPVTI
jgi:aryl-alcohol dehydrogenase-like predicted oxidoreductase